MKDNLKHYGVLGMKWGVRQGSASTSNNTKSAKSMSDDELRKTVNRMQMEKQYSQLTSSSVKKGGDYVSSIIKTGTTIATVTSTGLTIYNNAKKIQEILNK